MLTIHRKREISGGKTIYMKTSEKLIATLCDPENKVCISGSDEDRQILQEAIEEVQDLEKYARHMHSHVGKDKGDDSCSRCGFDLRHNIHIRVNE